MWNRFCITLVLAISKGPRCLGACLSCCSSAQVHTACLRNPTHTAQMSLLAAASATRKRLGSRGTKRAAECAQLGAQIAMGHAFQLKTQNTRDQINEHLDAHPEQVEACMLLLSQGFCDPEKSKAIASGDLETYIPDSATTLENISNKVMVQAINFLHPELFTIPVLAKIKKTGKKSLCALFCFLVQEVPKAPTPTHIIEVFNKVYKDRYEQLGKRGQLLTIVDSTIHWERSGTYRLEARNDSQSFTHIVHASGIEAAYLSYPSVA